MSKDKKKNKVKDPFDVAIKHAPDVHQISVSRILLANIMWRSLSDLMSDELSRNSPEPSDVAEAKFMIDLMDAVALKRSEILIKIVDPAKDIFAVGRDLKAP